MTQFCQKNLKIACVGDNCMDVYDKTGEVFPGGNPVNVAVYTMRMGGAASYTGVVGNDDYGRQMRSALESKGVDVSHLRTENGKTAVTHVALTDGERVLGDYDEGVMASFCLAESDLDFICGHGMAVSGLWGQIERQLPIIRARGVQTAFDFTDKKAHPVIDAALPHVDYAFFSRELATETARRGFLAEMHKRGPTVVIVTLGADGSMAYDGARFYAQEAAPCRVVDTMGAGDSFIAGFLYARMRGASIADCMQKGAQASAQTLQYSGAW